jgi:hypothetical protein
MSQSYQDIIDTIDKLSLHDRFRLECYLYSKTEEPEKVRQVKRQLSVGDQVKYFDRDENRLLDAMVLELKRTRLLVQNVEDGKKWRIVYAAVCLSDDPLKNIGPKSNKEKLTKVDVQVGEVVSFFDNDDQEQIGKIIKLNPKRAKVLLDSGVTWNVSYQSLSRVLDGETFDNSKIIDVTVID